MVCNAPWLPFSALHHMSYIPLGTRKKKHQRLCC